jgi:hypothetical protein
MRKPIRRMVGEMLRRGVSSRMALLAVTRVHPTTRLKLARVKQIRREVRTSH